MKIQLHCVGCGELVPDVDSKRTPVVPCGHCGASSPILQGDSFFTASASLLGVFRLELTPPHLEIFLGYSDHTSPLKSTLAKALRMCGATTQSKCSSRRCQIAYRRGKRQWKQLKTIEHRNTLLEQERQYRILEIGEP